VAADIALRPLEHVAQTSPFGVRFWDVAARDFVRSGLRVSVGEVGSSRVLSAFQNGSGVWIVRGLRLKRPRAEFASEEAFLQSDDFRWGDGREEFWTRWSTPVTTLALSVDDDQARFVPYRFKSAAPQRGFARRVCGEGPADAMPVYPAPARAVPSGMAVVRAQLAEPAWPSPPSDRRPAAWAYVEVWIGGAIAGSSYADRHGRVAVMFPWPTPIDRSLHSPPAGSGANALINQSWRVQLRAYYQGLPPGETPDLCEVLAQPPVTLLEAQPDEPLGERELRYGRELVVRSGDTDSPPVRTSDLMVRR
jgi:hypothetical protein